MKKNDIKFELRDILQNDANEINVARNRSKVIHKTRDIDASGDQVEQAVRNVIARKLASKYYVGHGHILDSRLDTSPQLDVIIADNSGAPVWFRAENGTEYFPYEAVYAIGEIKSTYYSKKKEVEKFVKTIKYVRHKLKREETPVHYVLPNVDFGPNFVSDIPYRSPLFSFIVFVAHDKLACRW